MSLFRNPEALWLLLLLPLLAWRHWRALRGGGATLRHPAGFAVPGSGAWAHHLHFAFKAAAFALLVVALARPQQTLAGEDVSTEGVDIMLALDTSGSMDARDFQPRNRLEVAKRVTMDFIKGRVSDRIGLVVFSARAITRCPLTVDYDVLLQLVDSTHLGMLPDGTAIGNALATAASRLRLSKARSKVAILVTDGVNNTGEIDPLTAADMAQALGLKVYTVGVGKEGPVPIPVMNPYTGKKQLMDVEVKIDEDLLREISRRTGGRYFRATDADALRAIFKQIDSLEKSEVKVRRWADYIERFMPWAAAALALLGLWIVLGETVFRKLP